MTVVVQGKPADQIRTVGDLVTTLQQYKFTSPNWELPDLDGEWPEIKYAVRIDITYMHGTETPLMLTVVVQESGDGITEYGYSQPVMCARMPTIDIIMGVKMVFPQYVIDEALKKYVS